MGFADASRSFLTHTQVMACMPWGWGRQTLLPHARKELKTKARVLPDCVEVAVAICIQLSHERRSETPPTPRIAGRIRYPGHCVYRRPLGNWYPNGLWGARASETARGTEP